MTQETYANAPVIDGTDSSAPQEFAARDSEGGPAAQSASLSEPPPMARDTESGDGSIRYRVMALGAMLLLAVGALSLGIWSYFQ